MKKLLDISGENDGEWFYKTSSRNDQRVIFKMMYKRVFLNFVSLLDMRANIFNPLFPWWEADPLRQNVAFHPYSTVSRSLCHTPALDLNAFFNINEANSLYH